MLLKKPSCVSSIDNSSSDYGMCHKEDGAAARHLSDPARVQSNLDWLITTQRENFFIYCYCIFSIFERKLE